MSLVTILWGGLMLLGAGVPSVDDEAGGGRALQLAELRRWVTEQPRTFDNQVYFAHENGTVVRSARFALYESELFGDYDGDGDVDLADYGAFEICYSYSGPGRATVPACLLYDADADTDIDLADTAEFMLAYTGERSPLLVEAGGLFPSRSTQGSYSSGVPGTPGNNALNGHAAQASYTQDDFWYEWTVDGQPAGSGQIILSNSSLPATAYYIGAPAKAGDYIFRLTVTNIITGESADDTVTLALLDNPQFRLASTTVARRNVVPGTIVTFVVEYNVTDTTTFNIWSKETADTQTGTLNQYRLAQLTVGGTPGPWASTTVEVDTSLLPIGAGTLLLGWSATDAVGITPSWGTAARLAKTAAAEPIWGRRGAAITIGRDKPEYTLAGVTSGTSAINPAEPVGLTLATEVGTPVSIGTAYPIQPFMPGQVIYPGIGDNPAVNGINHTTGTMMLGYDINNDGLTDMCYSSGANIEVLFGAVDILTDNAGGGTSLIGEGVSSGAAACAGCSTHQDWRSAGTYTPNVRSRYYTAINAISDLAVGDFNNDGNLDFAYVGDAATANQVSAGFVFLPGNPTGDPFANAVNLTYETAAENGDDYSASAYVAAGDFNGDGITDAAFGIPGDSTPETGATDNEGSVTVIYGQSGTAGFPASGGLAAIFQTGGTAPVKGFRYEGQAAFDIAGSGIILADVTGGSSVDLIFEQRLLNGVAGSGMIAVVAGASNTDQPDTNNATYAIGDPTAGDFIGVSLAAGDLTAGAKLDLVVSASSFDTASSASGVNEGAVFVIPGASLASANINALPGTFAITNNRSGSDFQLFLGRSVGVFDYNGDGPEDLLVAHNSTANNTVYVKYGPVFGTGINFSNGQNGFDFRLEAALPVMQIAGGDLNADGVADLCLFGANTGVVLVGLEWWW